MQLTSCRNNLFYNSQLTIKVGTIYFKTKIPKAAYNCQTPNYGKMHRCYDGLFALLNNQ